jgi:hypothetical protein
MQTGIKQLLWRKRRFVATNFWINSERVKAEVSEGRENTHTLHNGTGKLLTTNWLRHLKKGSNDEIK